MPEVVESAVRLARGAEAERAFNLLEERTSAAGTLWTLGIQAYCRALLSRGDAAEAAFRSGDRAPRRVQYRAVTAPSAPRARRMASARASAGRGREQLKVAHAKFMAMGALGFAERAHRELLAAGATAAGASDRPERVLDPPTPQELQVARLAAVGASNH